MEIQTNACSCPFSLFGVFKCPGRDQTNKKKDWFFCDILEKTLSIKTGYFWNFCCRNILFEDTLLYIISLVTFSYRFMSLSFFSGALWWYFNFSLKINIWMSKKLIAVFWAEENDNYESNKSRLFQFRIAYEMKLKLRLCNRRHFRRKIYTIITIKDWNDWSSTAWKFQFENGKQLFLFLHFY